jgi:hypothetical protein
VTEIEFNSDITDKVTFGQEVGRLETVYSADDWVAGNRRGFNVRIFGDNLWGHHVVWADAEGIAATRTHGITDPKSEKPLKVVGIEVQGLFWSAASPGRKVLHLDGIKIPFDLEVKGFPEEKKPPAPELRFVRLVGGRYEPVAELRHGDEFYVEASYAVKPPQPPAKAELSWTDGQPRDVEFTATEDAKLFRSPRMKLESPTAP